MPAARAAGQLPGPAGVARGDRHHPRGRPADLDHDLAAVPGDVAAAQRHQLAGPQPRPDAEHHQRQRRGRVSPGRAGRPRARPAPPAPPASTAPAPSRPGTASPAAPAGRAPPRRAGTAPTGTCPGSRTPGPPGRPRRTPRSRHSPAGTPGRPGLPGYQRTGTARAARGRSRLPAGSMPQARARRIFPASHGHA